MLYLYIEEVGRGPAASQAVIPRGLVRVGFAVQPSQLLSSPLRKKKDSREKNERITKTKHISAHRTERTARHRGSYFSTGKPRETPLSRITTSRFDRRHPKCRRTAPDNTVQTPTNTRSRACARAAHCLFVSGDGGGAKGADSTLGVC